MRHTSWYWGMAAVMAFISQGVGRAQPLLSENGMLLIDGEPRFILGLYETPDSDAVLEQVAEAGFNLIHIPASVEKLDQLQRHGLYGWINLGGQLALSEGDEAARQRLADTVNRFKEHPALLVWEGPDEALWNVWYGTTQYYHNQEFPAMRAAIEAAEDAQAARLEELMRQARERWDRGQWTMFEELRESFWQAAGKQLPNPEMRMSTARERALELGEALTRGLRLVRELDPRHVRWLNHAPRNSIAAMAFHNREADMAGCDIYPAPVRPAPGHSDLTNLTLTSVGAYTERMRAAAPGKAVAMVLQGFGWRDLQQEKPEDEGVGRRPDYDETRFMAYDAIVHGANAILYWGTAYIEKDSDLWHDLLTVVRELSALEPALAAPVLEPQPTAASEETLGSLDGEGPRLMLRKAGDDYVLIAVNETNYGLDFTVSGLPAELNGRTLYRLNSDEQHRVAGGSFRDGIPAWEVYVYATSRAFQVER